MTVEFRLKGTPLQNLRQTGSMRWYSLCWCQLSARSAILPLSRATAGHGTRSSPAYRRSRRPSAQIWILPRKGTSILTSASTGTAYLPDLLGPTTVRTLRHRQPVRRPSKIRWANRPQTEVISRTFSNRRLPSDDISIQSHPCRTTNSLPRHRHDRQHGSDPPYTYLLVSAVSWLQRISNCHGRPPYLLSAIDTGTFLFPVTRPSLRIGSLPRKNASILASASTDTANLSDLLGPTTVRTPR
jgi:hypothetical protein